MNGQHWAVTFCDVAARRLTILAPDFCRRDPACNDFAIIIEIHAVIGGRTPIATRSSAMLGLTLLSENQPLMVL